MRIALRQCRRLWLALFLGLFSSLFSSLLLGLLLGLPLALAAQTPGVLDVDLLVDPSGSETIATVSAPGASGRFVPQAQAGFMSGFTHDVHWLRFTLQPNEPGPWWLEVQPGVLDDLRLFVPDAGGYVERRAGDRQSFADREHDYRAFLFKLDLPDAAPRVYYLRFQTTSSSHARLALWRPDDFHAAKTREYGKLAFYFGVASMALLLNLVLWHTLRLALSAWFCLFIASHMVLYFGAYGLASQLLPVGFPLLGDFCLSVGMALHGSSAAILFGAVLVRRHDSALWRLPVRIQTWLPWLMIPAYFSGLSQETARLVNGFVLLWLVWLLVMSIRGLHQHRREAHWVLVASLLSLANAGVSALGLLGVHHIEQVASAMFLLSSIGIFAAMQMATGSLISERRGQAMAVIQRQQQEALAAGLEHRAQLAREQALDQQLLLLSEREREHALLTATVAELRHAQALGKIGNWERDLASNRIVWSEQVYRMLGFDPGEPAPNAAQREAVFIPVSWRLLKQTTDRALVSGESFVLELELVASPCRARWVEIRGALLRDAQGLAFKLAGTMQDISDRRSAQEAAAAGAAELIFQRNQSEFLARVSHEMRTPLNAVSGLTQLLALDEQVCSLPVVAEQVGLIQGAADHLKSMIDDVLDLARIRSDSLQVRSQVCAVGPLAAECLSWLTVMAASRQISLRLEGDHDRWHVRADLARLRQILINLLSNAIKYNRIGGVVVLALSCEPAAAVDGSAARTGWICLSVSDTGPGLTQRQLEQLYQPFNRLGAELGDVEGTGLGLAVTKELVEAMGGSIQARSQPGQGSVFTLRLPAVEPSGCDKPDTSEETELAAAAAAVASTAVKGEVGDEVEVEVATEGRAEISRAAAAPFVVLYVEDNRLNAMVMRLALKRLAGVRLELATDGRAGLALAQQLRPDLLLIDMNLPEMTGTELLQRLRSEAVFSAIPCVAISANSLSKDIEQALAAGFDEYITKPFAIADVIELVDRLRQQAALKVERFSTQ